MLCDTVYRTALYYITNLSRIDTQTLNIHSSGTSDPDTQKHYAVPNSRIDTHSHLMAHSSSPPLMTTTSSLPPMVPESWFYRDPQNTVQGPYETASMRQWHEARYFTPDLPIKLAHWQEFHSLGAVFPDSDFAFSPDTVTSEPFTAPSRHSHPHGLGPPPMRPLQSEIMDIDIILRQQQEQRQHRMEELRRLEIAQMQRAAEEQREAEKLQQQQQHMVFQCFLSMINTQTLQIFVCFVFCIEIVMCNFRNEFKKHWRSHKFHYCKSYNFTDITSKTLSLRRIL